MSASQTAQACDHSCERTERRQGRSAERERRRAGRAACAMPSPPRALFAHLPADLLVAIRIKQGHEGCSVDRLRKTKETAEVLHKGAQLVDGDRLVAVVVVPLEHVLDLRLRVRRQLQKGLRETGNREKCRQFSHCAARVAGGGRRG